MTISGVSTTTGYSAEWDNPNVASLSPDDVLQYVATRLGGIDDQIQDYMNEANNRRARSDELRRFQDAVRAVNTGPGFDTSGIEDDEARAIANANACDQLDAAISQLHDPELQKRLGNLRAAIVSSGKISAQDLQDQTDFAKDQLTALNSDNELTMMRLNSLFQLRSQVISASSNEEASINDGAKAVIGNMRA